MNSNRPASILKSSIRPLLALLLLCQCGCGDAVSAARAAGRRFVSDAAMAGEVAVSKIREQLLADDGPQTLSAVVRGRVYAGEVPPFEDGRAEFAITDATGHDGDSDHDPWTCPFCKRSIQDYIAQVRFLDESGKVIQADARDLFDIKENQVVIVEGTARIVKVGEDSLLQIDATQVYVKR